MVIPGTYDITLPQRADFELEITLPIDLTNKTVYAEAWTETRTQKLIGFAVDYIDRVAGEIKLTATWEQTKAVKKEGQWDLLVVDDLTDLRDFWIEGALAVDPGYTEEAP